MFTTSEISQTKRIICFKNPKGSLYQAWIPTYNELKLRSGHPFWGRCYSAIYPNLYPIFKYSCLTSALFMHMGNPPHPIRHSVPPIPSDQSIRSSSAFDRPSQHLWTTVVFHHLALAIPTSRSFSVSWKGRRGGRRMLLSVHGKGAKGKICLLLAYQVLAPVRGRILAGMGKQASWEWQPQCSSQQTPFQSLLCIRQFRWPHRSHRGTVTPGTSFLQQ